MPSSFLSALRSKLPQADYDLLIDWIKATDKKSKDETSPPINGDQFLALRRQPADPKRLLTLDRWLPTIFTLSTQFVDTDDLLSQLRERKPLKRVELQTKPQTVHEITKAEAKYRIQKPKFDRPEIYVEPKNLAWGKLSYLFSNLKDKIAYCLFKTRDVEAANLLLKACRNDLLDNKASKAADAAYQAFELMGTPQNNESLLTCIEAAFEEFRACLADQQTARLLVLKHMLDKFLMYPTYPVASELTSIWEKLRTTESADPDINHFVLLDLLKLARIYLDKLGKNSTNLIKRDFPSHLNSCLETIKKLFTPNKIKHFNEHFSREEDFSGEIDKAHNLKGPLLPLSLVRQFDLYDTAEWLTTDVRSLTPPPIPARAKQATPIWLADNDVEEIKPSLGEQLLKLSAHITLDPVPSDYMVDLSLFDNFLAGSTELIPMPITEITPPVLYPLQRLPI